MRTLDWLVLVATLGGIVGYGLWRAHREREAADYLRGGRLGWLTIGLAVMATQASAITFLSTPGLAFEEGMGFVQFYFGMPLAVVVVAAVFVPIYYRLKVFTAYEYLEKRFDPRVRVLGALLFLVQRGLAAGITIYAPSIVLSTILGWPLHVTNLVIGVTVIAYTVLGGTNVVSKTQKQQMVIILLGMFAAGVAIARLLPDEVSVGDATALAGLTGRMEIVDLSARPDNRYSLWSGLAGGFFLALSYFGTDQSQVQRYLGGTSTSAGRLGLLFNGLFKIPMQFLILFIGILLFAFYVFVRPPIHFDPAALERARSSPAAATIEGIEARYHEAHAARAEAGRAYVIARDAGADTTASASRFVVADEAMRAARVEAKRVVAEAVPGAGAEDADFIFISFVLAMLPAGLVGLLVAVIMSAAMSSIASELNALGTTTTVDLVARFRKSMTTDTEKVRIAKLMTIGWGLVALGFASVASLFDNLIEAVNVLGSLFYGTMLGLFVVAFFLKRIGARAVFWAGIGAQATVLALFFSYDLAFLWFNVIGCALVVVFASILEQVLAPA